MDNRTPARLTRAAVLAVAALAALAMNTPVARAGTAVPGTWPSATPSPAGCPVTVSYAPNAQWPGGFQAAIQLHNIRTAYIAPGWVLTFRFTDGETVVRMFSVSSWTQVGPLVTAVGPPWAGLAPNGTFVFGFTGNTPNGPPSTVTAVTFNGTPC